jgi:branched-chain amino acid transport system ATP-binding protein
VTALLDVEHLSVDHGQLRAVADVSVTIQAGETVALIGANGAGKSTFLSAIAGLTGPALGAIRFRGQDITAMPAHRRPGMGISLVPEGRRLFPSLTVRENLLTGVQRGRTGPWTLRRVLELFPMLGQLLDRGASYLSGGEQQAVAIGRALMANPDLLLLDEVSLGLAPIVVEQVYGALPAIREQGTTVLLVEQDVGQALSVADHVLALLEGRVVLAGAPHQLQRSEIVAAYFGVQE